MDNGTKMTGQFNLSGSDMSEPIGRCSNLTNTNDTSGVIMKWKTHTLTVNFKTMDDGNWIFQMLGVMINVNVSDVQAMKSFSGETTFTDKSNGELFRGQTNHAYSCEQDHLLPLKTSNATLYNITVDFQKIFVQPFENKGTKSKDVNVCPSGENTPKSSSIVPIAVGCALAGLIVIVLIAYLIGRRKSDSRGYQQV